MKIHFSGGPFSEITRLLDAEHPLVVNGYHVIVERQHTRPRGALAPPMPRRGAYVRVGNVALWWGWDGTRPDVPDPLG